MATRTIQSPGVEIREIDLTQRAPSQVGTDVFIMGFANSGPTDEILNLGEISDFEQIYGLPTNAAERYFYHSVKQTFNSDANVYVSRLPYGEDNGLAAAENGYTALAYPVQGLTLNTIHSDTYSLSAAAYIDLGKVKTVDNVTTPFASGGSWNIDTAVARLGIVLKYTITDSDGNPETIVYENTFDVCNYEQDGIGNAKHTVVSSQSAEFQAAFKPLTGTNVTIHEKQIAVFEIADLDSSIKSAGEITSLADTGALSADDTEVDYIVIGSPTLVPLTNDQYNTIEQGEIVWGDAAGDNTDTTFTYADIGEAGIVVLNTAKTNISQEFEGYYLGLSDGANNNPATDFDTILNQYTLTTVRTTTAAGVEDMQVIPASRMSYSLSASKTDNGINISRTLEEATEYNISSSGFEDTLTFGLIKTRITPFSDGDNSLSYILAESYTGSVDSARKVQDVNGGPRKSFYLEELDDKSPNIKILVNPYMSKSGAGSWVADDGEYSKKTIRVGNTKSKTIATLYTENKKTGENFSKVNGLYPIGFKSSEDPRSSTKVIGSIPQKIGRIFQIADNVDLFNIDISVEAGLGTIFVGSTCTATTSTKGISANTFDDTERVDMGSLTANTGFYTLKDQFDESVTAATSARDNYRAVFNAFEQFARQTRKDHIFIADPLRYTLVQGENGKVLNDKANNFSQHVYWPLRHNFAVANSNYATTYGNWVKSYDGASGKQVWIPFSGNAAAMYARTDANFAPWFAPAGYTRGVVSAVTDIAISPSQRQRDQLYRVNINPITQFPQEGIVVFGQKTLQKRPTAFDRVNVRRLFLNLEKRTRNTIKYFLFEPNTFVTRNKIVNTLRPIFEKAKQTEGVYDYLIVCDERNNTADVINNNELVVDIYLKPVRAAEFILVNFFAVNNDVNFEELINQ